MDKAFRSDVLAWLAESLADFGQFECDSNLNQFSNQWTFASDASNDNIISNLDLKSPVDPDQVIRFCSRYLSKNIKYQQVTGYDPEYIREMQQKSCTHGFHEYHSEQLGVCNMGEYGSGGIPLSMDSLSYAHFNSVIALEASCIKSTQNPQTGVQVQFLELFEQETLGNLALRRAARSINLCWKVSCLYINEFADWLHKVAVHAACTMERVQSRDIGIPNASLILFQLSRETGWVLGKLSLMTPSKTEATVNALLIDAGFGFISAAICLLFSQKQDKGLGQFMYGLAESCESAMTVAIRMTPQRSLWRKLLYDCIRSTNFCPSRASLCLDRQPRVMLHLIARSEHLKTTRKLHEKCGEVCCHVKSVESHHQPGHLEQGCVCTTTAFDTMETSDLVLLDTVTRQLIRYKANVPLPPYIAVSQVWFQGIFGQASRVCGECSLKFLSTTCNNIGIQHAWVDTLCMPKSKELRHEVVKQLKNIYLNAGATLVIDAGLMVTVAKTVLDLSLVIFLSDWSSRIWTLQEGVLASKLLFCVKDQILSFPQVFLPHWVIDPRNIIPVTLFQVYGIGKDGQNQSLEDVLRYAVGRQTSWEQDYLYGLSALLPHTPKRHENLHFVAKEVAEMYPKVDLGMLLASFPRCNIPNYRWMPCRSALQGGGFTTRILGDVTPNGLQCHILATVKLSPTQDEDILRDAKNRLLLETVMDVEFPCKYWFTTKVKDVVVGTDVEGRELIYCLVLKSKISFGFVVSLTESGQFQYMGRAGSIGEIPEKQASILIT
ncbi:hypothetical protein BGZ76_011563 [Entomortierella beljakovae]|nr:hypothetical protein BGZ76_011563 [Entomortierella beljakovae]